MDSLHDLDERLKRLGKLIIPKSTPEPAPESSPGRTHPPRYQKMAAWLGGELVSNQAGTYCLIKSFYPFTYLHGTVMLDETLAHPNLPLSAFTALEETGTVSLSELVYFDTETTGLGGAGIVPFLIGCGRMTEYGFEVRQYIIPDYSDEAAMLEAIQEELTSQAKLVTYNGAAFDVPVLRDRYIINRVARSVDVAGHIDLLHPTRRLFKRRVKECSLNHIEKRIFDFWRDNDIPGYLVPSVYFEWLHSERLDKMTDVIRHNRYDIISLHFLLTHIAQTFRTDGAVLDQADDIYSLSRVYRRRNHNDKVLNLCERIASESSPDMTDEILLFHASALKRAGEWERAQTIWMQLAEADSREAYRSCLELAIYFEHRCKEFKKALDFTKRAASICPPGRSEQLRLSQRRTRLEGKLGKKGE